MLQAGNNAASLLKKKNIKKREKRQALFGQSEECS